MAANECSFNPCDRYVYCKGFCQGHYNQQYKGKELTPFLKTRSDYKPENVKRPPVCSYPECDERIARGGSTCGQHKRCKKCLETKSIEEFYRASEYKAHCKSCVTMRPMYLRHHLTKEQYDKMLEDQNGLCANPNCNAKAEVIDHDHSCCPRQMSCGKCVRGILCSLCNSAEGYLRSNANLALGLAEYIIMNTKIVEGLEAN